MRNEARRPPSLFVTTSLLALIAFLAGGGAVAATTVMAADSRSYANTLAAQHEVAEDEREEAETALARVQNRKTAMENAVVTKQEWFDLFHASCLMHGGAACKSSAEDYDALQEAKADLAAAGVELNKTETTLASMTDAANEASAAARESEATAVGHESRARITLVVISGLVTFFLAATTFVWWRRSRVVRTAEMRSQTL